MSQAIESTNIFVTKSNVTYVTKWFDHHATATKWAREHSGHRGAEWHVYSQVGNVLGDYRAVIITKPFP